MIVADTNVVSELMRDDPVPSVVTWAERLGPSDLTICVVTVEEIERGLGRLPSGRRRRDLLARWRALAEAFEESILVYDTPAARRTAELQVRSARLGRPMSLADAQVAGICLSRGCDLATRNTKDFVGVRDLVLVDPFA